MDKMYNGRCCEFEQAVFNDTIHYATFGKSGNVFRLKRNKKKNHFFLNEGRFSKNPDQRFGDIARQGSIIIKNPFADTLFVISDHKRYPFVISHCCEEE